MPATTASSSARDASPLAPAAPSSSPASSWMNTPPGTENTLPPVSEATEVKNSAESAARAAMARLSMPRPSTP